MLQEQSAQQATRDKSSDQLASDVGEDCSSRQTSRRKEANGYRWIKMGAGDIADRIDHREDDETKGQRDANMRNRAADVVNYNRARARENQRECADRFCSVLFH